MQKTYCLRPTKNLCISATEILFIHFFLIIRIMPTNENQIHENKNFCLNEIIIDIVFFSIRQKNDCDLNWVTDQNF